MDATAHRGISRLVARHLGLDSIEIDFGGAKMNAGELFVASSMNPDDVDRRLGKLAWAFAHTYNLGRFTNRISVKLCGMYADLAAAKLTHGDPSGYVELSSACHVLCDLAVPYHSDYGFPTLAAVMPKLRSRSSGNHRRFEDRLETRWEWLESAARSGIRAGPIEGCPDDPSAAAMFLSELVASSAARRVRALDRALDRKDMKAVDENAVWAVAISSRCCVLLARTTLDVVRGVSRRRQTTGIRSEDPKRGPK